MKEPRGPKGLRRCRLNKCTGKKAFSRRICPAGGLCRKHIEKPNKDN